MGRVKKDKGSSEHIYLDEPLPPVFLNYSGLLWRLVKSILFPSQNTCCPKNNLRKMRMYHCISTWSHTAICLTSSSTPKKTEKAHNLYLSNLGKLTKCCSGSCSCINIVTLVKIKLLWPHVVSHKYLLILLMIRSWWFQKARWTNSHFSAERLFCHLCSPVVKVKMPPQNLQIYIKACSG